MPSVKQEARLAPEMPDEELERAIAAAGSVPDPEIPVITLGELGILRGVARRGNDIVVTLTPTYTGCPATAVIRLEVEMALARAGLANARVETVLSPAWSTDDITPAGREKLLNYGIAPPPPGGSKGSLLFADPQIDCPKCGSGKTSRISEFGSTPCKALWRCETCAEPFEAFKCL